MNGFEDTGLPQQVIDMLSNPQNSGEFQLVLHNIGSGYTAIRDDDLPLARSTALMVVAFLGSTLASWAPTAIAMLIFFLIDIQKKGIQLSPLHGIVLKELSNHPGLSVRQIASALRRNEEEVLATLDSLKLITNIHNRIIPLVEERDDQKWYALDV